MQLLNYLKEAVMALVREEEAQGGIEYLLTLGGVLVAVTLAIVALVWTGAISAIFSGVCSAINGISGFGSVSC